MRRFLALLLLLSIVEASRRSRLFQKLHKASNYDAAPSNVETVWYKNMRLDHFTWGDTRTFDMRVMWNNTFYKPGGPIFFYTGNEGGLESFVTATGIMFDLAPMYNASIIFAEHRFYGQTQPFGNNSYATLANVGYLTSEQALADYAELLTELKRQPNQFNLTFQKDTQIISFGGSYGGMLSAWFRQKYPHIVKGAWAGSAPLIYMHDGGVDPGAFDNITSRTYVDNGCNRFILANVWNAVLNLSNTDAGRQWLNNNAVFTLDPRTPIRNQTDGWNLNAYLREAIEYMAMVDYPYPTGFLEPLPAWPVAVACGYMNATGTTFSDQQLVTMVANAANIYYNYNKDPNFKYCIDYSVCGDQGTGGLGGDQLGWPWQECSEIIMAMCARGGSNDVFWSECGANIYDVLKQECVSIFGSMGWTPSNWNIDAVKTLYGYDLSGSSNLILTQGHLDPWSGGGYKVDQNNAARGIYVLEIPGSAHHLDLRQPNTCDPNTVTNARFQIIQILNCWVNPNCNDVPTITPLPTISIPVTECKDVVGGYPWGQTLKQGAFSNSLIVSVLAMVYALF
ncbi:CRE-PCP-1 protein [Caenorhabditis remanei]|uniref:CRE-PCP-1 protein n=1 Tax=Caenorhabditis remanei TaxID=31234 RepID=E3MKV0_CAERE|nr:CRE-PCP-1 protein [Caenorhabditis remanei]